MNAGFVLTVPHDWFEVELRPNVREASIKSLVHERVRGNPDLKAARPGIVKALLEFAEQAWTSGAVYCACFVQPTQAGPITGSLTVTVIDPPALDPSGESSLHSVLDVLERDHQERPPTVVTIEGVGEAARTYGVEDVALPNGPVVRSVIMQTFVPIPESSRFVLISGNSPVLWLEDELFELFDAVTSTFRFTSTGLPVGE